MVFFVCADVRACADWRALVDELLAGEEPRAPLGAEHQEWLDARGA